MQAEVTNVNVSQLQCAPLLFMPEEFETPKYFSNLRTAKRAKRHKRQGKHSSPEYVYADGLNSKESSESYDIGVWKPTNPKYSDNATPVSENVVKTLTDKGN